MRSSHWKYDISDSLRQVLFEKGQEPTGFLVFGDDSWIQVYNKKKYIVATSVVSIEYFASMPEPDGVLEKNIEIGEPKSGAYQEIVKKFTDLMIKDYRNFGDKIKAFVVCNMFQKDYINRALVKMGYNKPDNLPAIITVTNTKLKWPDGEWGSIQIEPPRDYRYKQKVGDDSRKIYLKMYS